MEFIEEFITQIRNKLISDPHQYSSIKLIRTDTNEEEVVQLPTNKLPRRVRTTLSQTEQLPIIDELSDTYLTNEIQRLQQILQSRSTNSQSIHSQSESNQSPSPTIEVADATDDPSVRSSINSASTANNPQYDRNSVTASDSDSTNDFSKRKRKPVERFNPPSNNRAASSRKRSKQANHSADNLEQQQQQQDQVEIDKLALRFLDTYQLNLKICTAGELEDTISKQSISALGGEILLATTLSVQQAVSAEFGTRISSVIVSCNVYKMVAYYLRSVIAHKLKQSVRYGQYNSAVKKALKIKSPNDLAAYPSFYELIQRHYASESTNMESLLKIPLFLTDIRWFELRELTNKHHKHIIDAALEKFHQALQAQKNWMELNWIEEFQQAGKGKGIRATEGRIWSKSSELICDLHTIGLPLINIQDQYNDPTFHLHYYVQLKPKHYIDLKQHWIGRINHLPPALCNVKITKGKLLQIRDIAPKEPLALDYGTDYWVRQITGFPIESWSQCAPRLSQARLSIFKEMHETVLDYKPLLDLSNNISLEHPNSVELENVFDQIIDHLYYLQKQQSNSRKGASVASTSSDSESAFSDESPPLHEPESFGSFEYRAPATDSPFSPISADADSDAMVDDANVTDPEEAAHNDQIVLDTQLWAEGKDLFVILNELLQKDTTDSTVYVSSSSDTKTIRRCYLRATILTHPDKNSGDLRCAEKFKYLSQLWERFNQIIDTTSNSTDSDSE